MEKTYSLQGNTLEVSFNDKIVTIKSPEALSNFLSLNIEERTDTFAALIKNDYLKFMGKEFEVTKQSIIVEIWGHVYASYFAKAMKNLIDLKLIEHIADFVIERSDSIDCGEKDVDKNRIVWDVLSNFNGIILKFLPEKLK